VIELLNAYFVPVYVDGTYLQAHADTEADELAAYREMFTALHRANGERQQSDQPQLSTGTVHAYVFAADGRALDSRHVAHAGPASVIEMLEKAVKSLSVSAGEPIIAPHSQSPRPDCADDAVVLHLTSRYLVPRNSTEARQGVDGELVPLDASRLGGERSGQWSALPSEDWFVLQRDEWTRLLPKDRVAVGDTWQVDEQLAETLLTSVIDAGTGAQVTRARIRRAQPRVRLGDFHGAAADLKQASAEVEARGDTALNALLYGAQGELAYESGRLDEARRHFEQSATRWVDDQPDPSSIESRAYVGLLDALAGRPDSGRALVRVSLTQAQKMGRLALEARARVFLARIEIQQRRFADAIRVLEDVAIEGDPPSIGPELAAHVRYWRGYALGREGHRSAADTEQTAARSALEALRATLPAQHRDAFAARRDIRLMRQ
jgi:tetratricopeptide (TPR) repeat protein